MHGDFILGEISKQFKDTPENLLEIYIDTQVTVEMACTPIASVIDIQNVADLHYMDRKKAAEHIFNVLGLPISDMHVTAPPEFPPGTGPSAPKRAKILK